MNAGRATLGGLCQLLTVRAAQPAMAPHCRSNLFCGTEGSEQWWHFSDSLNSRHSLLVARYSLILPLEVRAKLLWLWGQGDPENTSLTDLMS